jgi:hypothetical protein
MPPSEIAHVSVVTGGIGFAVQVASGWTAGAWQVPLVHTYGMKQP